MGGGEQKKSRCEPKKSGGDPSRSGGGQYVNYNWVSVISLLQLECSNVLRFTIRGEEEGSEEGNRIGSHQ